MVTVLAAGLHHLQRNNHLSLLFPPRGLCGVSEWVD